MGEVSSTAAVLNRFQSERHRAPPGRGGGSPTELSAGYSPAPLVVLAPLGPPEIQQSSQGEQGHAAQPQGPRRIHPL